MSTSNICSFSPVKMSLSAINERFKLIQRELCYAMTIATTGPVSTANNGLSLSTSTVVLGQNVAQSGSPAALTSDREIPLNTRNIVFTGTGRIGIGPSSPAKTLDIRPASGTVGVGIGSASTQNYPSLNGGLPANLYVVHGSGNWGLNVTRAINDTGSANIVLYKTRNADASIRTPTIAGDSIGTILFQAPISTGTNDAFGIRLKGVSGTPATTHVPMSFVIETTNTAGTLAERIRVSTEGRVYIGGAVDATAILHLPAGTATASTAPLKLTAGTNLTTPENGAFEFDGTNLYFTTGGVRKTVTLV